MTTEPGWEDYEPKDRRTAVGYALMVFGLALGLSGSDVVLDLESADRLIDALEHVPGWAFSMTAEEPPIHVYPFPDSHHDIDHGLACWCRPYRDSREARVIIHRKGAAS